MNIESLLSEADPMHAVLIPEPNMEDARVIMSSPDVIDAKGEAFRWPLPNRGGATTEWGRRIKRPAIGMVLAAVVLISAGVVVPLVEHHQSVPGGSTTPIATKSVWSLTGYITQPGWQVSSASGPLPTSQQNTLELTCPTSATCYSTGVDNHTGHTQGVISVTHDGGATWQQSLASTDGTYFSGISCPTTSTCMAVGTLPSATSHPQLYRTIDGGKSWTAQQIPGPREIPLALSCSTTLNCTTIGLEQTEPAPTPVSYFTTDGGQNWTSSVLPSNFQPSGTSQSPLDCFADGRCIATGSTLSSSPQRSAFMIYSVDGGATWTAARTPSIAGSGLMSCANSKHCVSIEMDFSSFQTVTGELMTNDGGASWTVVPATGLTSSNSLTAPWLDSISCPTTLDCWASAHVVSSTCQGSCPYAPDHAEMLVTTDGGQTWIEEALPASPVASLQYVADYPVDCVSSTNCRAVGTLELTKLADENGAIWAQQDVMLTFVGDTAPSASTTTKPVVAS
jgi:photosystem II stability/assembly factor-like uncharacterized protein